MLRTPLSASLDLRVSFECVDRLSLALSHSQFPYWTQLAGAKKFLAEILRAKNSDAVKEFVVAGKLIVETPFRNAPRTIYKIGFKDNEIDSLC